MAAAVRHEVVFYIQSVEASSHPEALRLTRRRGWGCVVGRGQTPPVSMPSHVW